jgi:filamin
VFVALVTTPSGLKVNPSVTDKRNGTVSIQYSPNETGWHHLDVTYNNQPVEGSPFSFFASPIELGQVVAYGPGLSHGVATTQCKFTVNKLSSGEG